MTKNDEKILKNMIQKFIEEEGDHVSGIQQLYKEINEILKKKFGCSEELMLVSMTDALKIIPEIVDLAQAGSALLP